MGRFPLASLRFSKSDRLHIERQKLARISHRILPISGRRFVFTGDFLRERNNRAYFRPKKTVCGNKDQARSVISGEKCGLAQLTQFAAFESHPAGQRQGFTRLDVNTFETIDGCGRHRLHICGGSLQKSQHGLIRTR